MLWSWTTFFNWALVCLGSIVTYEGFGLVDNIQSLICSMQVVILKFAAVEELNLSALIWK